LAVRRAAGGGGLLPFPCLLFSAKPRFIVVARRFCDGC